MSDLKWPWYPPASRASSHPSADSRDRYAAHLARRAKSRMLSRPFGSSYNGARLAGNETMQGPAMRFDLRDASPGFAVLTCRGGLSWEDRELLAASVEQYLVGREHLRGLVLDMSAVDFVNSAGLGALFQLVQRLRSCGAHLAFASVPPAINRLLTTVGMQRLAKFGRDVSEALKLIAQPPEQPEATADEPPAS
jgi:anti-anti-sigma factor